MNTSTVMSPRRGLPLRSTSIAKAVLKRPDRTGGQLGRALRRAYLVFCRRLGGLSRCGRYGGV